MESMTGFGRCSAEGPSLRVTAEVRGVNQKGLDVHLRIPAPLLRYDLLCREKVRERVARGRVEVFASLEFLGPAAVEFRVARGVAAAAGETAAALRGEGLLDRGLTMSDLLALPDAVSVKLAAASEGEAAELLTRALGGALDGFCATRAAEGARLRGQFDGGIATLREALERARPLLEPQVEGARERLRQRLAQLGVQADPGRLEQEVALAAQKSDVAEEVRRLEAHLEAMGELVASGSGDLGRRLDHLLQEVQREISTLLAKSGSLELTREGMTMRLTAEQLREQAQNVA